MLSLKCKNGTVPKSGKQNTDTGMKTMSDQVTGMSFMTGARRAARLALICIVALVIGAAAPVGMDHGIVALKSALAANDNDRGNSRGGRKDDAPGQTKKNDGVDDGAADPADAIGAEGGGDPLPVDLLPIGTDEVPVNIEVIKEIAGLPDESSLSEQEELEAIQNGWGNWRTADGPTTSTIQ